MISSIRRTIAAALALACCLGAAILPSRAASTAITYDTTTKLVVMPTAFWTSNVVAATGYTPTNSAGRLALILDANLLDLVDGSLTGSKVGSGINGDNITTGTVADARIDSALARDTELTAAIAALSTVYQPLDADLTDLADGSLSGSKVGSGISADNITTGTVADARIAATIARLASPALTGTPTVNGTNFMALIASGGGGGGSGNADTNNSTAWANSTSVSLYDLAIRGTATIANLSIGSASYSGIWGFANGGHGATNAAGARTALGLEKDVDVQTFRLPLLQLYVALAADGDMPYRTASGIITNAPSTTAGRTLLTAANAAAQRSSMGVPALAGDTFTGAIRVPGDVYDASSWTNGSKTNEVPTKADVARKIEALSVGGYIASVASDFQVSASQLSVTNTVGSGRIVRETATGATASMSGLSDVSISSTNDLYKGDYLNWSGSNWVRQIGPGGITTPDQWEEIWYNCQGSISGQGFSANSIGAGSQSGNANVVQGRIGYHRLTVAASPNLYTGAYIDIGASNLAPTNEFLGRLECLLPTTNAVIQNLGFHDGLTSTNAATEQLCVVVTNGVANFVASMAGTSVKGSQSYVWATNEWHSITIRVTNQVASVTITTNGVVAMQDALNSANVPGGGTVQMGFGANGFCTGAASTNGQNVVILKRLGMRYRTY